MFNHKLHSAFLNHVRDPVLEIMHASKHRVRVLGGAAWAAVTNVSVQFPTTTNLADKWTTAVTMATRDFSLASISCAHHPVCHVHSDRRKVFLVAHFV